MLGTRPPNSEEDDILAEGSIEAALSIIVENAESDVTKSNIDLRMSHKPRASPFEKTQFEQDTPLTST